MFAGATILLLLHPLGAGGAVTVSGPFYLDAAQGYTAGAVAAEGYAAGVVAGEGYTAGAVAAQGVVG